MASEGHLASRVIIKFSFGNIHPQGKPLQKHVVSIVTVASANHNMETEYHVQRAVEAEDILTLSRSVRSASPQGL